MRDVSIAEVPAGFTEHTDDSSRYGYPTGVTRDTIVEVVIVHEGRLSLHGPSQAASFGWQIEPHAPSSPGLQRCGAPITHYRVVP